MGKKLNLIGQKFNRLLVISQAENSKDHRTQWLCRCDCGNHKIAQGKLLKSGQVKSCGCLQKEAMKKLNEKHSVINKTFERLRVIKEYTINNERVCDCKCSCGNEVKGVKAYNLKNGNTKSCGCYKKERLDSFIKNKSNNELSHTFRPLLSRCKSTAKKKNLDFDLDLDYLYSLWIRQDGKCIYTGSKLTPLSWHEGSKDKTNTASLDRIDSSKGYIKGNIQFVSTIANYAKNTFSHKDMISFCKDIALFWKDKLS